MSPLKKIIICIFIGIFSFVKCLVGRCHFVKTPLLSETSNRSGLLLSSMKNCAFGKGESTFISRINKISTLFMQKNLPGNCPWGKLPFRWFVGYIIAPKANGPEKNCPTPPPPPLPPHRRKIVPRINYTRDIFSPRIRNRSSSITSYYLLLLDGLS